LNASGYGGCGSRVRAVWARKQSAGIGLYNGSSGTTHVVVDEQGYFIAPPA
jgi:hypothetical protein